MVMMEEKLVINELQQGKELANLLMSNLKHTSSSSVDPKNNNKSLISEILRIYQNAILMLSLPEDENKNKKRRNPEIGNKDSSKKRKMMEKKTEKVRVLVGKEQEKGSSSIDDGYCWRKYGQKDIHGSKNPRGYYRCTHRFTQNCLAVKQVQKSDKDPSIFEVKYLGDHTCTSNNNTSPKTTNTNFSVSVLETEQVVKPDKKITEEEAIISIEDLESKKEIFRTFSFSNLMENNIFSGNLMGNLSSPATTSGSGITSEIVPVSGYVENSQTVDSYFSSLDNIVDIEQDWLWSQF